MADRKDKTLQRKKFNHFRSYPQLLPVRELRMFVRSRFLAGS